MDIKDLEILRMKEVLSSIQKKNLDVGGVDFSDILKDEMEKTVLGFDDVLKRKNIELPFVNIIIEGEKK